MRIRIYSIVFTIALTTLSLIGFSQPGPPQGRGGPPRPCPPNNPNCQPARVPINGSILLLLAGGIGFGIRTIKTKKTIKSN
jgi:hypothetical protein